MNGRTRVRGNQLEQALRRAGATGTPGNKATTKPGSGSVPNRRARPNKRGSKLPFGSGNSRNPSGPAIAPAVAPRPLGAPATASPAPARTPRTPYLERSGQFSPNPLLTPRSDSDHLPLKVTSDGSKLTCVGERRADNAADLILGLDFGTSSTKAVIRDHTASSVFAVPMTRDQANAYLLPSRVYRDADRFTLDPSPSGTVRRDLKLRLLSCLAASPVDEFIEACAFLALVLRHCRGWLFDRHAASYSRMELHWRVNLGLPARSYEDDKVVTLFRRLAWAAANVSATEGEVTYQLCDEFRQLSRHAAVGSSARDTSSAFLWEDVDVVPEIVAQIHGFVEAVNWDWKHRPMMMVVDVGAGTVDTAFFSVQRNNGHGRYTFFANDVQPAGVMNLHRHRVGWLEQLGAPVLTGAVLGHLQDIKYPTDRMLPIPESVSSYLPGFRLVVPPGSRDIDRRFYLEQIYRQVASCALRGRREGRIKDTQLKDVPCILSGGGSRMDIYGKSVSDLSASKTPITLQPFRAVFRRDAMECQGLRETDSDRLSVAFGLSCHGAGGKPLGRFVRAMELLRADQQAPQPDWRDRYVSKDMM